MSVVNHNPIQCLTLLGLILFSYAAFATTSLKNPPSKGHFKRLQQLLTFGRSGHSVERLDDGRILIAGGAWGDLGGENSAEVLQTVNQQVRSAGLKMSTLRSAATHAKLPDGRIFFIGGATDFELALPTTDFFNPTTNAFAPGPNLVKERSGHASVVLPDGRVLVFGGMDAYQIHDSAEIFDPAIGSFRLLDSKMMTPRAHHSATLVNNNTIAIVGGETNPQDLYSKPFAPFLDSIELFDIPSMQFVSVDAKMTTPRIYHTATRLDDHRLLITGGLSDVAASSISMDILNVAERTVVNIGYSLQARAMHTITFMHDGIFLITGGVENGTPLSSSERCTFIATNDINCVDGPKMGRARWGHSATPMPGGRIVFVGGLSNTPEPPGRSAGPMRGLELFVP